jgi:predicted DCC family thiol-disulfide oxidoreductase YuxK
MTSEHSQDRSERKLPDETDILLVYDQQCPLCDFYSRIVRVQESVGRLVLVDAREDSAVMQEITAAGLDIDQGMVLKMGGRIYYGADAIHALSLISTGSDIFNRINFLVFRKQRLARVLYPVCRFFRNMLLKVKKIKKINNLNLSNNDVF